MNADLFGALLPVVVAMAGIRFVFSMLSHLGR